MVTFMNKLAQRTPIPAVIGQLILSAYVFSDESDARGVVLTFQDGSDLSIEVDREARVPWKVLQSNEDDGDIIAVQISK